jgi:hypothetical protein
MSTAWRAVRDCWCLAVPFSALLTGVGVVALAGIVVNNNIILIDTFNHVRRQNPWFRYPRCHREGHGAKVTTCACSLR